VIPVTSWYLQQYDGSRYHNGFWEKGNYRRNSSAICLNCYLQTAIVRRKRMGDTEEGRAFLDYINGLRAKKEFTMRQLCEGLCSLSVVQAMEDGCWDPDQLLQESILERLGVAAEDYSRGLDHVDYDRWLDRLRILHSITFVRPEEAEERLTEYEKKYGAGGRHERQFLLAMRAQAARCLGRSGEEVSGLLREAAGLTVPGWETEPLEGRALSIKELNLILEAEHCRGEGERTGRYREILDYISRSGLDGTAMAKIYPKAVYFLCRSMMQGGEDSWEPGMMLRYSGQAVEVLRDNERMYYLWELVTFREELARERAAELEYRGEQEKSGAMRELGREMGEWRRTLEEVYAEKGVPKETFEFCYFYVMKGVYCINDVIRIRRKMLGLSQQKVCEDICDEKTLRRIEHKRTRPRKAVVRKLMRRLKLSEELTRTELVTDSQEARELMTQLRDFVNAGRWEEAERARRRIEEMVPMEITCNRQTIMSKEMFLKWKQGEMGDEEYLDKMRGVLEETLPYDAFLKSDEIYLTGTEQVCILNRMQALKRGSGEHLACMKRMEEIYQFYVKEEVWEGAWNMYEFAMRHVGSERGNIGEYDKSDYYNKIILEGCLRFRRMSLISQSTYGMWWNYDMRKQSNILSDKVLVDEKELNRCIQFSNMCKDKYSEIFYCRKLEMKMKK